ncbi:MAG: hypothetical protein CME61_02795 [Halobacteriovoraceae bacterium]|nr:hypothetical protein [Halobacteriovoraceae bacterium]
MNVNPVGKEDTHTQTTITPVIAWELKSIDRSSHFNVEKNIIKRILANLMDYGVLFLFITPFYFYVDHLFIILTSNGPISVISNYDTYQTVEYFLKNIVILSIALAYYYYLYRYKGTTVGKKYFNLSIYRYNTFEPIGLLRVFFRELLFKPLAVAVFPATLIHYFFQGEGLFIHDILSKSFVVKETH